MAEEKVAGKRVYLEVPAVLIEPVSYEKDGVTHEFFRLTIPRGTTVEAEGGETIDIGGWQMTPKYVNESKFKGEDYRVVPLLADREVELRRTVRGEDGRYVRGEYETLHVAPGALRAALAAQDEAFRAKAEPRAERAYIVLHEKFVREGVESKDGEHTYNSAKLPRGVSVELPDGTMRDVSGYVFYPLFVQRAGDDAGLYRALPYKKDAMVRLTGRPATPDGSLGDKESIEVSAVSLRDGVEAEAREWRAAREARNRRAERISVAGERAEGVATPEGDARYGREATKGDPAAAVKPPERLA